MFKKQGIVINKNISITEMHEMIKPTNPHFVSNKSKTMLLRYEIQHLYSTKGK